MSHVRMMLADRVFANRFGRAPGQCFIVLCSAAGKTGSLKYTIPYEDNDWGLEGAQLPPGCFPHPSRQADDSSMRRQPIAFRCASGCCRWEKLHSTCFALPNGPYPEPPTSGVKSPACRVAGWSISAPARSAGRRGGGVENESPPPLRRCIIQRPR